MATYRMLVRRRIEEDFEFSIEAPSSSEAHQMMQVPEKLDQIAVPPISSDVRVTVVTCHPEEGAA